jgi:hypothetical protein
MIVVNKGFIIKVYREIQRHPGALRQANQLSAHDKLFNKSWLRLPDQRPADVKWILNEIYGIRLIVDSTARLFCEAAAVSSGRLLSRGQAVSRYLAKSRLNSFAAADDGRPA